MRRGEAEHGREAGREVDGSEVGVQLIDAGLHGRRGLDDDGMVLGYDLFAESDAREVVLVHFDEFAGRGVGDAHCHVVFGFEGAEL